MDWGDLIENVVVFSKISVPIAIDDVGEGFARCHYQEGAVMTRGVSVQKGEDGLLAAEVLLSEGPVF